MAQMIFFPQHRNVGKARRVAFVYLNKATDRAKSSYWGETCRRLEIFMRRCGFDNETIERELMAFKTAVEQEMALLLNENGGAA